MDRETFNNMSAEEKEELLETHDCNNAEDDSCEICAWFDCLDDDMDDDS